ncbi:MAG: hypothetical protein AAF317_08370 [Pseudomonadota bacterium]
MAETLHAKINVACARYAFGNTRIEGRSHGGGVPGRIVTGQCATLDEEFGRRECPRRSGPVERSAGQTQPVTRFVAGRVYALENA